YAAMRDGIFRSDNAGERWTRAENGPRNVAAVVINPKKPTEVYAVTADGKLFRSLDGGARWAETR
ncbi:MAG: WD40/YVTN/BNR-like repeat-containing protein, partial [Candidatus Rokuibacteriota bacterium]